MSEPSAPTEDYSSEHLQEVRDKLTSEIEKAADLTLFDEKEYKRLLIDDVHLKRYVRRNKGDVNKTIPFLVDVLKWRKKMGVPDMSESTFPREFYGLGGIHIFSTDKDGHVVLHVRLKLFQKIPEIMDLLKKFTVFQMLRADEEGERRGGDIGWVLLFDCTGAGLANADIEMASFVNNTLKNYFPSGQKYVLSHNLPWLLNALKIMVFTMIPSNIKKRIKFSNDKTINEYIPAAHLPAYMNGTSDLAYPTIPTSAIPTTDMYSDGQLTLSSDEQLRVKKYYEKLYGDLQNKTLVAN